MPKLSRVRVEVVRSGRYRERWTGLMRWFDEELGLDAGKVGEDVLARRCALRGTGGS